MAQSPEQPPEFDDDVFSDLTEEDFPPESVTVSSQRAMIRDLYASDQDLDEDERQRKRHQRSERGNLHLVKLVAMWMMVVIVLILISVFFWHAVMPDGWCWLSDQKLGELKSLSLSIISGLGASVALSIVNGK